jgi:phosphoglycerate dehydrogenase-like enzyme
MKLLIVLHHRFELWRAPAWLAGRLRRGFPQVEIVDLPSYEEIEAQIRDAEIVIAWSLRSEQLKSAHQLRWIHSPAAAVHQLMLPEVVNSNIVLTNGRDINGPVVAEHVIALILALAKNLAQAVRLQKLRVWGQETIWNSRPRPREIAGATLGLVGLGSIGSRVAKHAAALGMRVMAVRETLEKPTPEGVERVLPLSEIDDLVSQSDYLALTVPVTPATRDLMNASRFAKMKPDACLINVGRGPLVDEVALLAALRERRIGGAALDVFEQEPLPVDSPLWDLEHLLITPHTAGLTEKLWDRQYALIEENLRRYLEDRPLLAMVDKHKGY